MLKRRELFCARSGERWVKLPVRNAQRQSADLD
jgi:hypothetical protein